MSGQMWMSTQSGGAWVKTPDSGGVFTPVGWLSKTNSNGAFLNGGTNVRRSKTTHMEYNMSWQSARRLQVSPLRDFYAGVYGPGLIYFIDPMAADLNVLPEQWAFPASACYDGVPIISATTNGVVGRPANVPTPSNSFGYPVESAQYSLTGNSRSLFIPIPPGFDAWVGVKGSIVGTGGVRVTPVTTPGVNGTAVYPAMLPVTSSTRVNTKIPGASNFGLILDITTGTASTVTLSAMCVQILPQGATPSTGNFIGGLGHSGCDFEGAPSITAVGSAIDLVTASWKLTETGDWQ